jgi:hypothetical protein
MIVKYLKDDTWGYIDNVRQASNRDIDCLQLIADYGADMEKEYAKAPEFEPDLDIAETLEGERLADDVIASNKVFSQAIKNREDWGSLCHCENLIDGGMALENYPAAVVLLYVEDHKEYDSIALVTNQKCFLMNDKGQTIERLV